MKHGYLRCSTDRQGDSGLGLEAQRALIESRVGGIDRWHVEVGVSGSVAPIDRPVLGPLLASLAPGDVLVVAKRDRLARDMLHALVLERTAASSGWSLVSASGEGDDDTPAGVLMRSILYAFAEYERGVIRQRTRDALARKKAAGMRVGSVPWGFTALSDGRLVENLDEQEARRIARDLTTAGKSSRAVARALTELGFKPRSASWTSQSVGRLISKP